MTVGFDFLLVNLNLKTKEDEIIKTTQNSIKMARDHRKAKKIKHYIKSRHHFSVTQPSLLLVLRFCSTCGNRLKFFFCVPPFKPRTRVYSLNREFRVLESVLRQKKNDNQFFLWE